MLQAEPIAEYRELVITTKKKKPDAPTQKLIRRADSSPGDQKSIIHAGTKETGDTSKVFDFSGAAKAMDKTASGYGYALLRVLVGHRCLKPAGGHMKYQLTAMGRKRFFKKK